jgi:hypothetical protein
MTDTLGQILNAVIPWAVWLFLIWILYTAFKKPIDAGIHKYKNWRDNRESGPTTTRLASIQYE